MIDKNTLVVFDFDGTLFKSPYKPSKWKGPWWSNINSLIPPLVPKIPDEAWWNEEIVWQAFSAIRYSHGRVILLTGRINKFFNYRVEELLNDKELYFDYVGLAELDTSISSKFKHLDKQLEEYPNINKIIFYDDREEHFSFFEGYCKERNLEYTINKVKEAYTVLDERKIPDNKLFILIGPPGSGKSTYIKENFANQDVHIISRDDIAERIAEENGISYNDMFNNTPEIKELNSIVSEELENKILEASHSNKSSVIDMTNMNIRTRRNLLNRFSKNKYFRVAVDFTPDISFFDKLLRVNDLRNEDLMKVGKRKKITREVLKSMFDRHEAPSEEEGFDRVTRIDISDRLNKIEL